MMCDFIFSDAVPFVITERLLMASCKVLNLLSRLNIHYNYRIILESFAFALCLRFVNHFLKIPTAFGCHNLSPYF